MITLPPITRSIFRRMALILASACIGACGGGGGGSAGSPSKDLPTPSPRDPISLFAGNLDGPGSVDGTGEAAHFTNPHGVAIDSAGNLFISETSNHTIRKITPAGVVTTIAGKAGQSGSSDGAGVDARFFYPEGIAVDSSGNLLVADTGNHTIRKITPEGRVSTLAGLAMSVGNSDGNGNDARFFVPRAVAVDIAGAVYVADTGNQTVRRISPTGTVTTLAGQAGVSGQIDGNSLIARFDSPWGIAVDSNSNVYVSDFSKRVRKVTPNGAVSTLAGGGDPTATDINGTGSAASFVYPRGISVDASGNLFVTDSYMVRKISPAGQVTTLAGARDGGYVNGQGGAARFGEIYGIAVGSTGNIYVSDSANAVRKVTADGAVSTLVSSPRYAITGTTDGIGAAARFGGSSSIAVDSAGNLYVSDAANQTIRKVTPSGVVSTLAGKAGEAGSIDGQGSAARFGWPAGLTMDKSGNLFVVDGGNNTIRKIDASGMVSTIAGGAGAGSVSVDGIGTAARFSSPAGIVSDSAGNLFVAEAESHVIRKITPAGVVSTFAGTPWVSGSADGTGSDARFYSPSGISIDSAGNLYVTDSGGDYRGYFWGNNTIRKITPAGVVTTLAGTANALGGSADGTGSSASFSKPMGIAVDQIGNVYVADLRNSTVRKITPAGVVTAVIGVAKQADFVEGSLPGRLDQPVGLAIFGTKLYITLRAGIAVVATLP